MHKHLVGDPAHGSIAVECWTFHFDAATRSEPHKGAAKHLYILIDQNIIAYYSFPDMLAAISFTVDRLLSLRIRKPAKQLGFYHSAFSSNIFL